MKFDRYKFTINVSGGERTRKMIINFLSLGEKSQFLCAGSLLGRVGTLNNLNFQFCLIKWEENVNFHCRGYELL